MFLLLLRSCCVVMCMVLLGSCCVVMFVVLLEGGCDVFSATGKLLCCVRFCWEVDLISVVLLGSCCAVCSVT